MRKMMKKRMVVLSVLTVALSALLSGCGGSKLADSFDEEAVTDKTGEVVGYLGEEDYDSVYDMFDENLKEVLPAETLKASVDEYGADRGAFKEIKNIAVVGQKNKETEEDAAVAVAVVSYENQKITYTITFNTSMDIIGLYLK